MKALNNVSHPHHQRHRSSQLTRSSKSSKTPSLSSTSSKRRQSSQEQNSFCFGNLVNCFRKNNNIISVNDKLNDDETDNRYSKEITKNAEMTSLAKSEQIVRSTMLIQRWYRRYKSRIELRKLTAWQIYQSIEYSGEQDQLKLYNFFLSLIKNSRYLDKMISQSTEITDSVAISSLSVEFNNKENKINNFRRKESLYSISTLADPLAIDSDLNLVSEGETKIVSKVFKGNTRICSPRGALKPVESTSSIKKSNEIKVESSYSGIEVEFPIRKQTFHDLVNSFKSNKPLHAKYVILILQETANALKKLKNVNILATNVSKNITIVGDLHGQLDDLLMIFYKNGFPSDENPYLFNGDFVDRGQKSIEVTMIIFCGFLMSPTAVYMNRGNHEDYVMNLRYGFLKEICLKYRPYSKRISNLYNEVFSWLPLASLIDNQIFVVHGGVSDRTSLNDLKNLKREKYISVLKPPMLEDELDLTLNLDAEILLEWRQVVDVLWSDPRTNLGIEANSLRGGGCFFGPDVTEKIVKENNFKLIIRSHECKQLGYEYAHNNLILTVFSASNYYDYGSNNGAYAKISSSSKPVLVQYYVKEGKEFTKNLSIRERVNAIEVSAINHLLEKFMAYKTRLLNGYKQKDVEKNGTISINDWCQVTTDVLELKLPWRMLRPRLVKLNCHGMVLYESTFEGLSSASSIITNADFSFTETIYRHKDTLESIFRAIDKDHSGQISREEFRDCCMLISHHDSSTCFTEKTIEEMANTIDMNKDGFINLNEFLESFRIVSAKLV